MDHKLFYQRKWMISNNDQLSDPITLIHCVPKPSPFPLFFLFFIYVSDIPQPNDAQVILSQFADDIANRAQTSGICSINLRLQKYLNQVLTWYNKWIIKLNSGRTHFINFSQRKVIQSVKPLEVHVDNLLNMKLYVENIERASLITRMRITRL